MGPSTVAEQDFYSRASGSPFTYWWRLVRFLLLRRLPRTPSELPLWALCVPWLVWAEPCRYDGTSFRGRYSAAVPGGRWLPLRLFYALFLVVWPLFALPRALAVGLARRSLRAATHVWRTALFRPELPLSHPGAYVPPNEVAWSRPDYAWSMLYAWLFVTGGLPRSVFALDDKHEFLQRAEAAGLPLPKRLTIAEARGRSELVVVKDPQRDLGYGVTLVRGDTLPQAFSGPEPILQERLLNHPRLRALFSDAAPLSTLRVVTQLRDGAPQVVRCAVRIGRAGAPVDNTQQGGIWSCVPLQGERRGRLTAGVTRRTAGEWSGGAPIRHGEHPDTRLSFVDAEVPYFEEGQALALAAHRALAPRALTLGWDIGLAEARPVVLEVNVWTTTYDYDPETDLFGEAAALMLTTLARTAP